MDILNIIIWLSVFSASVFLILWSYNNAKNPHGSIGLFILIFTMLSLVIALFMFSFNRRCAHTYANLEKEYNAYKICESCDDGINCKTSFKKLCNSTIYYMQNNYSIISYDQDEIDKSIKLCQEASIGIISKN